MNVGTILIHLFPTAVLNLLSPRASMRYWFTLMGYRGAVVRLPVAMH
jgi:hypothetical protein